MPEHSLPALQAAILPNNNYNAILHLPRLLVKVQLTGLYELILVNMEFTFCTNYCILLLSSPSQEPGCTCVYI